MGRNHRKSLSESKKPTKKSGAEVLLSVKEFPHHPKNHLWYLGIGLLLLASLVLLYQLKEYLLMAVVLALGVAVFRLANLEPRSKQVKINSKGVYWGSEFLPYFQLRAFWVAESNNHLNVYIERLNLSPQIHFTVPEPRLDEVVYTLSEYLPFHHHKNEPLSNRLSALFRF